MYTFDKISQALKRKKKEESDDSGFQATEAGIAQGGVTADSTPSSEAKKESSDIPKMKDYFDKNVQDYSYEPAYQTYDQAKEVNKMTGEQMRGEEQKAFQEQVGSKKLDAWTAPTISQKDASQAPDPVKTSSYQEAMDRANKFKQEASSYQPSTKQYVESDTSPAREMIATKGGRSQLLRREFEQDTPAYTTGMLSLDQALAERKLDTREAGRKYLEASAVAKQQQQELDEARSMFAGRREDLIKQAEERYNKVRSDLDQAKANYEQQQRAHQVWKDEQERIRRQQEEEKRLQTIREQEAQTRATVQAAQQQASEIEQGRQQERQSDLARQASEKAEAQKAKEYQRNLYNAAEDNYKSAVSVRDRYAYNTRQAKNSMNYYYNQAQHSPQAFSKYLEYKAKYERSLDQLARAEQGVSKYEQQMNKYKYW